MAIWPFNRNKSEDSTLPEEVQNYYQAEKRERAGVAGLLAVATLLVTVVLAVGLFFGGRWVYRTVFDNNDNKKANTVAQNSDKQQPVNASTENKEEKSTTTTPAPTPTTNPTPTPTSTPAPTPTPAAQTPSNNHDANSDLPNTGPGDVAAIFIGTILVATASHYALSNRPKVHAR